MIPWHLQQINNIHLINCSGIKEFFGSSQLSPSGPTQPTLLAGYAEAVLSAHRGLSSLTRDRARYEVRDDVHYTL